jgi:hypothetical protein
MKLVSALHRGTMNVKVLGQTRPRAPADVHPDVEAPCPHSLNEQFLQIAQKPEHLEHRLAVQFVQVRKVLIRGDHAVPAGIRKAVQQSEAALAPPQDEVLLVVGGIFPITA